MPAWSRARGSPPIGTCRLLLGSVFLKVARFEPLDDPNGAYFKDCKVVYGSAERLDVLRVTFRPLIIIAV